MNAKNAVNMQVNTLLCKSHMSFAIPCLKSFTARLTDDFALHIFDDGTLTESDFILLNDSFDELVVHKFHDYYDEVSDLLSNYPFCLSYRKISPLALKLLDLPLSSPGIFINLDSDIYFFKSFNGINRAKLEGMDFIGLKDPVLRCFGLTWQERYFNKKIPILPDKVNVGFIYMNKRIYDLDFIEWLLKNVFHVKGMSFPRETEQLVFAGLAAKKKSFYWDDSQIRCTAPNTLPDKTTVAIHYTHHIRDYLFLEMKNDNLNIHDKNKPDEVHQLELKPLSYNSILRYGFDGVVKRFSSIF